MRGSKRNMLRDSVPVSTMRVALAASPKFVLLMLPKVRTTAFDVVLISATSTSKML
jgi:hypothetical protein